MVVDLPPEYHTFAGQPVSVEVKLVSPAGIEIRKRFPARPLDLLDVLQCTQFMLRSLLGGGTASTVLLPGAVGGAKSEQPS